MMITMLVLFPVLGAVLIPGLGKKGKKVRDAALRLFTLSQLALALWAFCAVWRGEEMSLTVENICGLGLRFRADAFRALYVLLACLMWAVTAQFGCQYFAHGENGGRYAAFTMLTLCGVTGVFFSDDLYTTFVFFEIMSIASYPWVAHEETGDAMRAAGTYLGVSIACGMVTLMGMFLMYRETGDLSFAALREHKGEAALFLPAALTLVGYCAKAGLFPLHIWLPKAHPVAPAPASALLSGMLTKTGLFGVIAVGMNLMGESGVFGRVMLLLGLITMTLGAVLAVFSVNLKRTLASSSLSQIGYITVGLSCAVLLGHHGALPAAGAVGHMVNHSLLKLCLFLCAGAVYMNAHTLDLNALRGYGRGKKLLHIAFLLGALGLAGVPLMNGYASKTMIHEGLAELAAEYPGFSVYWAAEWVFLFAAGLTTAYMLKLYICLFWQKNPDAEIQKRYDALKGKDLKLRSAVALAFSALPLPLLGLFPNELLLPLTARSAPFLGREGLTAVPFFSWNNLMGGGISLLIGIAVYLLFVRTVLYRKAEGYGNKWPAWLDLETLFYRPVFCRFLPWIGCLIASALDRLPDCRLIQKWIPGGLSWIARHLDGLAECNLIRQWIPGGLSRIAQGLDKLPESRLFTRAVPVFLVSISRVFDEMTDHLLLWIRELFLVNRQELRRTRNHSIFTHAASVLAEAIHRAVSFLRPGRWLPHKSPTDMRYGTYVTNTISFGLLLCALGIVAAILYVFIRVGV